MIGKHLKGAQSYSLRFLFYRRICGALQVLASRAVGLALKLVLNIKESGPQKREFSWSAPAPSSLKKNLSYSYLFPSYPQNKRNKM